MQTASFASDLVTSPAGMMVGAAPSLDDMRALVARLKPHSAAEALRLLRDAYPTAPLSLRVAACGA